MIQAQAQLKFPSAIAKNLRDKILAPSRDAFRAPAERFSWDLFQVAGQYNHWRSSLLDHWNGNEAERTLSALGDIGRRLLGCQHISKPWISLYQDGHFQRLHTDPNHGPFAFVLSLSDKKAKFRGGETAIARESFSKSILNPSQPFEHGNHFNLYRLRMGDLLIFDGALPHEVLPVSGAYGLQDSRLSIHGWFTSPEVMVSENCRIGRQLEKSLSEFVKMFGANLENAQAKSGFVCIELRKNTARILTSTLRNSSFGLLSKNEINKAVPVKVLKDFGDWIRIPLQL